VVIYILFTVARITIIGTGYVGLTTGVCFAQLGHDVVCADIDAEKIALLSLGVSPIFEEGLERLIELSLEDGTLDFTTEISQSVYDADAIFLCVPTPSLEDGSVDISYIKSAVEMISHNLPSGVLLVTKSTVPVGTAMMLEEQLNREDVFVLSNPEFLKEGSAVEDFFFPDRIVIGSHDAQTAERLLDLYSIIATDVIITNHESAELIKYASNAFLATKLSFINSVATICEGTYADVDDVALGMGLDKRIGKSFLQAGLGWGGSCFPKDTSALISMAENIGYSFDLLKTAVQSNTDQIERIANKVLFSLKMSGAPIEESTVAVLGLTFKAGTDDLRNSPALHLVDKLLKKKIMVNGWDPTVDNSNLVVPSDVNLFSSPYDACESADVVVIATEWDSLKILDPIKTGKRMKTKSVVDARNVLKPYAWTARGFLYQGVGR